jgi:homocysteine S-methyltransferase
MVDSKYRQNLPQLSGDMFITDAGLGTSLVFHNGYALPEFASFTLLKQPKGVSDLQALYKSYVDVARAHQGIGIILDTPTWRASPDWAKKLGYSPEELKTAIVEAASLLESVRKENETADTKIVIAGEVGPRGDGYSVETKMSAVEAEAYHSVQIGTLRETSVDMICALTLNYVEEAIGITRAAQANEIPVVISFTVEVDGRLPSGHTLKDAIELVDAATSSGPVYYMINCAHPTHFDHVLQSDNMSAWADRIHGVRANASRMSHSELDNCEVLDDGNPSELGHEYADLKKKLTFLNVMGGCCGTDHRHLGSICEACSPLIMKNQNKKE